MRRRALSATTLPLVVLAVGLGLPLVAALFVAASDPERALQVEPGHLAGWAAVGEATEASAADTATSDVTPVDSPAVGFSEVPLPAVAVLPAVVVLPAVTFPAVDLFAVFFVAAGLLAAPVRAAVLLPVFAVVAR